MAEIMRDLRENREIIPPCVQGYLNYPSGRDEAVKRIYQVSLKPIIIAAFGVPDSGKTYLINHIGKHF